VVTSMGNVIRTTPGQDKILLWFQQVKAGPIPRSPPV
jgi:hypothetical protein